MCISKSKYRISKFLVGNLQTKVFKNLQIIGLKQVAALVETAEIKEVDAVGALIEKLPHPL